ncbi:hypothetical protein D4764_14G0001670 [Takifugu flavidus]|uniref:Uncharacterized protein n=1 Tax=Takifugu flavidus TaxID=433684 RepID=A0A5C6P510_9TELE|nr:hypothetical protein D4764_14G0001670 [Takifugu flavidus]
MSRLFLLNRLDSHLKMSECVMEEEERAESTVSSCVSMKSDRSKGNPENFVWTSRLTFKDGRGQSRVHSAQLGVPEECPVLREINNFRSSEEM